MSVEPPQLYAPARELEPELGSRALFGGLEPLVYANHAGISPPSILVRKAVSNMLADYGKHGAGSFMRWMAQRERLRGKLAALVGAKADRIALTSNTTRGVTEVATCFPWVRGDRVFVFDGEFPANVLPWQAVAEQHGLEIVRLDAHAYLDDEEAALARLAEEARKGVRLCAVSAVQFQTGLRMPLAAMSRVVRGAGGRLFVDAVQACGMVALDVTRDGIDFLAAGAHKWMMGLEGAGFLYATSEVELVPRTLGWLSVEQPVDFLLEGPGRLRYDKPARREASMFEGGNLAAASFVALEAALDAILALGVDAIFAHAQRFNDAVEEGALALGYRSARAREPGRRSGILALLPPGEVSVVELHRAISELGVATAIPDGRLRISPHWPNAIDESEQVVLTLEHALERVSSRR